jgi:hypothetical protein
MADKKKNKTTAVPDTNTVTDPVVSRPEGSAGEPLATKSLKKPKLAKKNKSRLPRRQKKARQKAAGRL